MLTMVDYLLSFWRLFVVPVFCTAETPEWTKNNYDPNVVRFAQHKDINSHQFYACDL